MKLNKTLRAIRNTVFSALVFFAVSMPFREFFRVMEVTELRPASALPPIGGLFFGAPGVLGCAIGNLVADIISGYPPAICALGFAAQAVYGALPPVLWRAVRKIKKEANTPFRLNNVREVVRYFVIMLINSVVMAALLGVIMQVFNISAFFSTATLMLLLNNFVFCMVAGIPLFIFMSVRKLSGSRRWFSLNERMVLLLISVGVISAGLIGVFAYAELSQVISDALTMWNRVFFYISAYLFVFYFVAVAFLWYLEGNITVPVERLTELAKGYIGADNEKQDGALIAYRCEALCSNPTETGILANAFRRMLLDMEVYIDNLTRVTAERERIGAELDVATKIQASMLPCIFPPFPNRTEFDIFASMQPAKEVGGDFYDFFMVDDTHLCVVIADVSGKGVPAALFMVIAKTLIKNYAQMGLSPCEVFNRANNQLCEGNDTGMFVTAFMGMMDIESGEFMYVNAGHNLPYMKKKGGDFAVMKAPAGLVLAGFEGFSYRENAVQLENGDIIFLYTDGATEAMNVQSEFFSEDRLKKALSSLKDAGLVALLHSVRDEIDGFAGEAPQFDDITMLAVKFIGTQACARSVLKLPAAVGNLREVLAFVEGRLENTGCGDKERMQLLVAVEELFVNIANYAYGSGEGETGDVEITLDFSTEPRFVRISFADSGAPYNPLSKLDPDTGLSADERQIGGLGIFMVQKSMDEMEYVYRGGQNMLTIKKIF